MAALTLQAVISASGIVTVTASTDDAIGSATAALVIDNTATAYAVGKAIEALERAYNRRLSVAGQPADISTSGVSVE